MSAYNQSIMGGIPYYNDFDEQKKFLSVLFKPGFPVQARELSQAQTILQNQIERFGSHIFKNGSVVLGGEITTAAGFFVRISNDTELTDETLERMVGQTIRGTSGDITTDAKIVGFADKSSECLDDKYQVLFCKFLTPGSYSENQTLTTVGSGNIGINFTTLSGTTAPGAGDVSTFVSVNSGIYYADGYFIQNDAQGFASFDKVFTGSTASYRDFDNATVSVGFDINRNTVSVSEDSSLRDPSFGFNNFNAPGADRYKIDLVLNQRGLTGSAVAGYEVTGVTGSDYVELVRIIDNKVTKQIKYPDYAQLEKTLARRTFDESGHYTVNPFPCEIDTYFNTFGTTDSTKFGVILGPGKAYVKGFEFETISSTDLEDVYPSTGALLETTNQYNRSFGPYIEFANQNKISTLATDTGNIFRRAKKMYFWNTSPGNQIIGSFNPTSVFYRSGDSGRPRMFISNIVFEPGFGPSDVNAISDDPTTPFPTSNFINFVRGDDRIVISGSSNKLFQVGDGVQNLRNPTNLEGIRVFSGTVSTEGFAVVNSPDARIKFDGFKGNVGNTTLAPTILTKTGNTTVLRAATDFTIDTNNTRISLNVGTEFAGSNFVAFIPIEITDRSTKRVKSLSGDITFATTFNSIGKFANLGAVDVFSITSIVNTDTGEDITGSFQLDNGQTPEAYLQSKIRLRADKTSPAENANISVTYKKFNRSGSDAPFTAESYSTISDANIPKFNGIDLKDYIDFRPDETISDIVGVGGSLTYGLDVTDPGNCDPVVDPGDGDVVTVGYGARIDSVILTTNREFKIVRGVPSPFPEPPDVSPNDMELYRLHIPAGANSPEDIRVEYIDNQRFTMKEIGEIERTQQLDSQFNYTRQLISDATSRAKANDNVAPVSLSGVYVDELIGHGNADVSRTNYNVSIDPIRNQIRPPFVSQSFGINTDSASVLAGLAGTTSNGDLVLTNYTEAVFASNVVCNSKETINEFGSVDFYGKLDISPYCVNYWSETKKPKVVSNFNGALNNWELEVTVTDQGIISGRNNGFGTTWKDWEFHWFSTPAIRAFDQFVSPLENIYKENAKSAFVARVLSKRIVNRINDRIVDLSIRPYIPETTITLNVSGLRPKTTVYAFLDGVSIGSATGYLVDSTGSVSTSITLTRDTYTVGKKKIEVMDNIDGDITKCTTSADAFLYAEGAIDTKLNGVAFTRPPVVKRVASNVATSRFESFDELFNSSSSTVLNTLNPMYQVFTVDPVAYPNGMYVTRASLWFDEASDEGTPVHVSIRPILNNIPSSSTIIALSETVLTTTDDAITVDPTDETPRNLIDNSDVKTDFVFESPVYLPPGDYALAVATNDTSISIRTRTTPDVSDNFGPLYLANNNGTNTPYSDRRLCVELHNATFDTSVTPKFRIGLVDNEFVGNSFYVSNTTSTNSLFTNEVRLEHDSGIERLLENGTQERDLQPQLTVDNGFLEFTLSGAVNYSSVVDLDRVSLLSARIVMNNAETSGSGIERFEVVDEIAADSGSDLAAPGLARYYSKIVELEEDQPADDIVVFIDGSFGGGGSKPLVFVKPIGTEVGEVNIEESRYYQLYLGGNPLLTVPNTSSINSLIFTTFKVDNVTDPSGDSGGEIPENERPGTFAEKSFNKFLVKIIFSGDAESTNSIPFIEFIGAVPIRKRFGSFGLANAIFPTGTILPFAGDFINGNVPSTLEADFVPCDGRILLVADYSTLYASVGDRYSRGDGNTTTGTSFRVPDLRGRTLVGTNFNLGGNNGGMNSNNLEEVFGVAMPTDKVLGLTGGYVKLPSSSVPPHIHQVLGREENEDTGGGGEQLYRSNKSPQSGSQRTLADIYNSDYELEVQSDGTGQTEQHPPYVAVNYVIKT